MGRKPSTENSCSATNESTSSNEDYEEPNNGIYSSIDEIDDVIDSDFDSDSDNYEDPSTYAELDATYVPKSSRSYAPLLRNKPPKVLSPVILIFLGI